MKKTHVYVIGEAGVNHNGDIDMAFALVDAAAAAGVDAIKFQTFQADKLAAKTAPKASYQRVETDAAESQFEMLKRLELPFDLHAPLQSYARKKGIEFLSTAFDIESLNFLNRLGVPLFKVPSGELTNGPLLWQFAQTRRPLILSTGMATLAEVEQGLAIVAHALNVSDEPAAMDEIWQAWSNSKCRESLHGHVTLLHCTSQYPTPFHHVNLRAMDTLASAFGLDVGYSDHTEGLLVPVSAVARGAKVIEKHFTLDRNLPGPDHQASLEPDELKQMVIDIRHLEVALGDGSKAPQIDEWDTRLAARQQVIATRYIAVGAKLTRADLGTARCGRGLQASALWDLVGKNASKSYSPGDPIEP